MKKVKILRTVLLPIGNVFVNYLLIRSGFFFFNLFLIVLDLHCCLGFSLVVAGGIYSLVGVCGHLVVVASLVPGTSCQCTQWLLLGSGAQAQ